MRDSKSFVTDGPFIETREQIAGYLLIHATDRDETIGIAARVPGTRIETVKVRPLIDIPGYRIRRGPRALRECVLRALQSGPSSISDSAERL